MRTSRSKVYHKLYCHLIWSTKNRLPMIISEIEEPLFNQLRGQCKSLDVPLLAINGIEDHIHLLVSLKPTHCPAQVVKQLKGNSSHFINKEYLHSNSLNSLYWQKGYGILSLGRKGIPVVKEYIEKQKEHHREGTTIEILEKCGEE